ncbi:MAG: hypothetical protein KatS3mg131_0509 [Candidatus Tectimicrobiota bacterium]|nr:MAG: hypothetical protein KatS3mg131_0509 [Candidatus Tectomicrobia bacterium]
MTLEECLRQCAMLSSGGYVLLRRGMAGKPKRKKWKVNVRKGGREFTVTGPSLHAVLYRAAMLLQQPVPRSCSEGG